MNTTVFIQNVNQYLDGLLDRIESAYWQVVESELNSGVLTLHTENRGTFIINRNVPRQELWLSSPISGGSHYTCVDGVWINTRTQASFEDVLFSELDHLNG